MNITFTEEIVVTNSNLKLKVSTISPSFEVAQVPENNVISAKFKQ